MIGENKGKCTNHCKNVKNKEKYKAGYHFGKKV